MYRTYVILYDIRICIYIILIKRTENMIDILLATYNGEKYLRQQLDSIFAQTYTEFRLYVSDDNSSDATYKILCEYENRYPEKVFISKPKERLGASANFLSLLEESEAEYIMFADQDDVWDKRKIEYSLKCMKHLESKYTKAHPLLIHSDLTVVDEELTTINKSLMNFLKIDPHRKRLSYLLVENVVTGSTIMMNKALKDKVKISQNCFMHDWWIALCAACFGKTGYINKPLNLYRQHGDNVLGVKNIYSLSGLITDRIKRNKEVKANYKKMYAQAQAFLEEYKDDIQQKDRQILGSFVNMQDMNRSQKICTVFKCGFFKNNILMNLGLLFNI